MAVRRTLCLIPIVAAALILGWPVFLLAENAVRYTDVTAQPGDIVTVDMIMRNDVVISGAYIPFRWSSPDVTLLSITIIRDRYVGQIVDTARVTDEVARTALVYFLPRIAIGSQGYVPVGSGRLAVLEFQVSPTAHDQVVYVDSVYKDLGGGATEQTQYSNFQGTQVIYPSVYSGRIVIGSPVLDIVMEAIPDNVNIEGTELGFDPPVQTLSVEATNGSRFGWEATWSSSWLTVTPTTGSAPSFLSIRAQTRDLSRGTYRDTVFISAPEANNSPLAVPVELVVNAPQIRLSATPESVSLEAIRPGNDSLLQTIVITSDAAVPVGWTAFANEPWLSLSPSGGSTPGVIDVSIDLREYAFGEYADTISVVSEIALNSPLRIPVAVVLDTAGVAINAFPDRISLSASVLSNQPSTGLLRIESSTGEDLDWSLTWTQPWLTAEPDSGRGRAVVSVSSVSSGLVVGTYNDTISIVSPTAKNSPLRVPVQFHVEAGSLAQNYPNPFSLYREPRTTIGYYLEQPDKVEIAIYNALGQRVRTLISAQRGSGEQSIEWDGRDSSGELVASGHYFYRMTTSKGSVTKRMIVIK